MATANPSSIRSFVSQDMLAMVGAINIEWDEIERCLFELFDVMLDADTACAHAIFYSQVNHRARAAMVRSLAKVILDPDPIRFESVERLMRRVQSAARKRNQLSHGECPGPAENYVRAY